MRRLFVKTKVRDLDASGEQYRKMQEEIRCKFSEPYVMDAQNTFMDLILM